MAVGLVWATAGCMVGPKYKRPETMADRVGRYTNAPQRTLDVNEVENADRWWERFGDPATAELVNRALTHNYGLRAGAARVLQAQAALGQTRGLLWPGASYNLTGDRSKRYFNFGGDDGDNPFASADPNAGSAFDFSGLEFSPVVTTWSQSISVTYVLDLWGRLRHAERAAWATLLATGASQQAVANSVIASVIQARVNIATLQRRLDIARANIKSWERTVEITERRYDEGLIGPVDVRLARTGLETIRAQEAALRLAQAMAANALDVLLAQPPGASPSLPATLPDLPELEAIPVGVPAALLDRRPDVKAAELQLVAANQRVGVSVAQLFPDLALTGIYGFSGSTWSDIWSPSAQSEIYSTIMSLSAPIFQGGQLRAQVKGAKARFAELASAYAGTVLTAMREVEDSLVSERLLHEQLEHVLLQVREARAGEELTLQRYEQGIESILIVLESQRQRRAAEEQLAVLKGQIWIARVNLHLALGGDWNRRKSPEKQVASR
ncbi:MAG: efflux transporter outer membrane subunit [Sedimentisphaerales bacterium]|nr:efflux transporter outer membrane subunit [Sedimentisphaerales bacterium]